MLSLTLSPAIYTFSFNKPTVLNSPYWTRLRAHMKTHNYHEKCLWIQWLCWWCNKNHFVCLALNQNMALIREWRDVERNKLHESHLWLPFSVFCCTTGRFFQKTKRFYFFFVIFIVGCYFYFPSQFSLYKCFVYDFVWLFLALFALNRIHFWNITAILQKAIAFLSALRMNNVKTPRQKCIHIRRSSFGFFPLKCTCFTIFGLF